MMEDLRTDEALPLASNDSHIKEDQFLCQNKRNKMRGLVLFLLQYILVSLLSFLSGFVASNSQNLRTKVSVISNTLNEEEKVKENVQEPKTASNQDTPNDHLQLSSYTYANCPFTMTKFSQFEMAKIDNFQSEQDRIINSMQRAKIALKFSNDARAYERVVTALEQNAFNRTIVLDGDSLTRQLFISLSCLAWTGGFVTDFNIDASTLEGDTNKILKNTGMHSSSKFF